MSGDEGILIVAVWMIYYVVWAVRWVVVDLLLVRVCYRLIRALLPSDRCNRVEEWWAEVHRLDCYHPRLTSIPGLVRCLSYNLIIVSVVLQLAAFVPLSDSKVAFAYHYYEQPTSGYAGAAGIQSITTLVEARLGFPSLKAVQLDSDTGAILASVTSDHASNSTRLDFERDLALARLLYRSQPSTYFEPLALTARLTWGWTVLMLGLVFLVAVVHWWGVLPQLSADVSMHSASLEVSVGAVCWLLTALPGALSLVIQWSIQSQPRFTLTQVGRPPLCLYVAAVLASVGWLLELLSCSGRGILSPLLPSSSDDSGSDVEMEMDSTANDRLMRDPVLTANAGNEAELAVTVAAAE